MKKFSFLIFFVIYLCLSLQNANAVITGIASSDSLQTAQKDLQNKIDTKQPKLSSSNVTTTGSNGFISAVNVGDGSMTITKSELTLPVGSYSTPTSRAQIWIE